MAFKGGFLIKPTESNISSIANLYLQGKMAIQQRKEELDKETSESVANLSDSVNYAATGIQDYDSMMLNFAASTRNESRALKDKFDRREIGLTDFNAGMARLTADAKLVAPFPKFIAERNKSITERVEKGELSAINLELTGSFKDKNATDQQLNSNYQVAHINRMPHLTRTYEYIEDGKKKVGSEQISVSAMMDPNRPVYRMVDTDADVKKFVDVLGDKGALGKYTEIQDLNGTKVYGRVRDDSKLESVKSFIEDRVESYGMRDLVTIAFEDLGFSATSFSVFDEERLKKTAERRKGAFKDASGKAIDFTHKDMILKTNSRGDLFLDEKQAELVRGYLRNKHSAAVSVQYDEKFVSPPAEPKVTKDELFKQIPLSAGTIGGDRGEDVLDIAKSSMREFNELSLGTDLGQFPVVNGEPTLPPNSMIKYVLQDTGVIDGSTASIAIPAELQTELSKTFRVTSFTGQPIKGIKGIIVTQSASPTDATRQEALKRTKRDIKQGDYHIMVIGPSALGTVKAGGDQKTSVVERDVVVSQSLSDVLTDSQAQELYQTLWDTNDQFKNYASGYTRNTKDYKEALYIISRRLTDLSNQ